MTIDRAKAYLIDSYSGYEQEISGASLDMSSAPYRIRLYLSRQDMNKRFRIKFFSSRCQHSREHYLYTNYYFDGFGAQLSTYLNLAKAH